MPFIKSSDEQNESVQLFYEDLGSGAPVVLIHGWPLSHEMWEYQVFHLVSAGYRVITYDRRGFGQSDKPWSAYDYDTLAGDLKAILDALDLQQVTLVGFSMGGGEVVRYCSLYDAARVSKLVLISSVTPYLLKTDDHPNGVEQKIFDGFEEKLKEDRPAFLATFGKQFFGVNIIEHPVSQALLEWALNLELKGSLRATIECMHSFSQTDFRSEMSGINKPVLLIHGDADKTVPIEPTSMLAARLVRNVQYKVYSGAPHGLFITQKEQLNGDLVSFIG